MMMGRAPVDEEPVPLASIETPMPVAQEHSTEPDIEDTATTEPTIEDKRPPSQPSRTQPPPSRHRGDNHARARHRGRTVAEPTDPEPSAQPTPAGLVATTPVTLDAEAGEMISRDLLARGSRSEAMAAALVSRRQRHTARCSAAITASGRVRARSSHGASCSHRRCRSRRPLWRSSEPAASARRAAPLRSRRLWRRSTLAVSVIALDARDGGRTLADLLSDSSVAVAAMDLGAATQAVAQRAGGIVILETPAVNPNDRAAVAALIAELEPLALDATYVALPATLGRRPRVASVAAFGELAAGNRDHACR